MTKRILIGLAVMLVALGGVWLVNYLALFDFTVPASQNALTETAATDINPFKKSNSANKSATTQNQDQAESVSYELRVVADNLDIPWAVLFTDENRILVSERPGTIRQIIDGQLQTEPVFTFEETATGGEIGLMGMTLHPDYDSNQLLYACIGYRINGGYADKVVQLRDDGDSLSEVTTIIDNIPAASNHAGCELDFGPDGKLYISTGDATERQIAQDLNSLGGKILRLNPDGTIPNDNPFANSAIYSYGHRNPQGFDWTADGRMYEAEHGPSGFDGPGGGDEINLITAGSNYGWPLVSHQETQEGTVSPLAVFTPAEAPSSLLLYQGDLFPQFTNHILVAALRGEGILVAQPDNNVSSKLNNIRKIEDLGVGRIREVTADEQGYIYFSTSNTDGRGTVRSNDDKLYQLVPSSEI